jgi:hypothetical protein
VVPTYADIATGFDFGATLSYEDISCRYDLPTISLYAKALTFGVATVSGTSAGFFRCHFLFS